MSAGTALRPLAAAVAGLAAVTFLGGCGGPSYDVTQQRLRGVTGYITTRVEDDDSVRDVFDDAGSKAPDGVWRITVDCSTVAPGQEENRLATGLVVHGSNAATVAGHKDGYSEFHRLKAQCPAPKKRSVGP